MPFHRSLFVGRAKGSDPLPEPLCPPKETDDPVSPEPTVLIVDDGETPRSTTCRMVRALGYDARAARDGREALRDIQQHPGEVRLVLTDVIMPYLRSRITTAIEIASPTRCSFGLARMTGPGQSAPAL